MARLGKDGAEVSRQVKRIRFLIFNARRDCDCHRDAVRVLTDPTTQTRHAVLREKESNTPDKTLNACRAQAFHTIRSLVTRRIVFSGILVFSTCVSLLAVGIRVRCVGRWHGRVHLRWLLVHWLR